MSDQADWDPREDQRRWYRHSQTGDRGYLVRRGGKPMVRLDRPNQEILKRLDDNFIEEDASRPLTPIHVARVCFEADKALCLGLGLMEPARADWSKLTDLQRQAWASKGPTKPSQRALLYAGIRRLMEGASAG